MKIFLDTNILFWLIYRLKNNKPIDYFEKLASKKQLYVSTFVLAEIYTLKEKLWITPNQLKKFLKTILTKVKIHPSKVSSWKLSKYVKDKNDIQILQDCLDSYCEILRTKNLKDFNTVEIQENLDIKVTDFIP